MLIRSFFLKYWKYLLLAILIYFPIFGHLAVLPIRMWDESRLAISAFEMLKNGEWFVTYFEGKPDMWSTKPPLFIWCQVFFMKLFGINELALRLPAAMSALFTCFALLWFSKKYLKSFWYGFVTIFVLVTSYGYISIHGSRTGDYDSMLTLFTTLSGLVFFLYCENKNIKYLYLFFLFTALAVLTKSISGLLFMPAILIYALIRKTIIPLLKNKHFYISLLLFLLTLAGYYITREIKNPGYLIAVYNNELGGRYLGSSGGHTGDFWFYYTHFLHYQLSVWYLLIPCGFIVGFASKNRKIFRLTTFSTLMIICYFLVISTAETKLDWYDIPLYPFIAIIIGIFIHVVFQLLNSLEFANKNLIINILPVVFLFFIGLEPYKRIIDKTYLPEEQHWDVQFYEIGYFLQDAVEGKFDVDGTHLLFEGYRAQNLIYLNILNDQGVEISFKDWTRLEEGDEVIAYQGHLKGYLQETYDHKMDILKGNVCKFTILGRKN